MSKFGLKDLDGDTLTITEGSLGAVITATDHHYGEYAAVAVRREHAAGVAQALLSAAGVNAVLTCPGCRNPLDDEGYGRNENCEDCFKDGAPETQEAVTAGTYEPEVPC